MDTFSQWAPTCLIVIILLGIIIFACSIAIRQYLENQRYLNGQIDYINEAPPMEILQKAAYYQIEEDFKKTGQKFFLKNGDLSVIAKKSIAAKTEEIFSLIVSTNARGQNCCSKEFSNFAASCQSKYQLKPIRRNYSELVDAYLTEGIGNSIDGFLSKREPLSINQFFALKKSAKEDFVGVYIIYNATKAMYYVGQATRVLFRLNQHFTGHGNGDVYADFKYGNEFTIQAIKLSESGTDDLDKLERTMIKHFNAYDAGYNKTVGNARLAY